ncbi:hypothetical protein FQK07_10765 [Synechococcus sp. BSF8S]|uniref:hypothetical protein n=1 Tax=Synechococcales TaxID=1890424 RepID=UPI001623CC10|nr:MULTISPECIES: hypothetical protein [unclassified Synechococcus]MBC1261734.1 hypothetical protein [Synechococcus sp. BSF8S]MBC1264663.1 hypothetical protein [Synechococcus sp. BSA11S]
MNNLLLQLAMAALSQLGGGYAGPLQSPTLGPRLFPAPNPLALPGPAPFRSPAGTGRNRPQGEQLASLAVTTCQLRSGVISRSQARQRLQGFGESRGWQPGWGEAIPLQRVDAAIRSAGGCQALLAEFGERGGSFPGRRGPAIGRATPAPQSPSEAEGFGLAPYR